MRGFYFFKGNSKKKKGEEVEFNTQQTAVLEAESLVEWKIVRMRSGTSGLWYG